MYLCPRMRPKSQAGFIGARGNLIWVNTGDSILKLRLMTGNKSRYLLIDPGFGFCIGKGEKYTRIFISAADRTVDLFSEEGILPERAHAIFFSCDQGDDASWPGKLNSGILASNSGGDYAKIQKRTDFMSDADRNHRLGLEYKNFRRNQIRIAPMKDSGLQSGILSEKVDEVKRWITDTLSQAKSDVLPRKFSVECEKETQKW